ncbi:MAG: DUF4340 domain-containing protein [Elusimicrobia bacterium]|nr:DUF4340 domain-containing protein [Elusimicrobiota bacterium]
MRPDTLARLAAVLAVLVALTLAAALWTRPSKPAALVPATLADDAVRLALDGPAGKVTLERQKSGWTMVGSTQAADGSLVQDVLGKLSKATLSGPVTEDPERYGLFGFAASSATRVKIDSAKAAAALEFYVGRDGPDYPSAFVRVAGQTGVFELSGVSAFELTRAPGEWVKKEAPPPAPQPTPRRTR